MERDAELSGRLCAWRLPKAQRERNTIMMRNLKVLGAALAAVFVLGAAFASFTSAADDLTAEKYPVTLTASGDEGKSPIFKTTAGSAECMTNTWTATGKESDPKTTTSATPTHTGCTCIGVACTVDMNGCTYKITMTEGTTSKLSLVCPAGKEITLTSSKCVIHIPPQGELAHTTWINIGSGTTREVTGNVAIGGINYSHTEGTGIGKCSAGSATNGTLAGKISVTGEEDFAGAGHIGIFLS